MVDISASDPFRTGRPHYLNNEPTDLGPRARSAKEQGGSVAEIGLIRWGVAMARKGGISADRVLNALDLAAFRRRLKERRVRCTGSAVLPGPEA
jgi:hypothetical protein